MNLAQNTFEGGLMMDLHPLSVPNTVLTNCLNGTYLTYNGNEYILLNDMGNGKVETAALPAGYIPLGTTSFGGIIYIVSYNPLKNVCQIGCFPSPERNFSYEELKESDGYVISKITNDNFLDSDDKNKVVNFKTMIELTTFTLNPGDKFLIVSDNSSIKTNSDRISDYNSLSKKIGDDPKYIRLRVATKDSSGRFVYLDSSVKWYNITNESGYYYIPEETEASEDLTSSKYSIFNSKLSGNLYLVTELETINNFSCTYSIRTEGLQTTSYTKSNPYIINSDSNWNSLKTFVESQDLSDFYVELNSDITVTSSIGTEENPFVGTINGNGHTITASVSLFNYTTSATIENIILKGNITSNNISGFITNSNNSIIRNCVSSIIFSGNNCSGFVYKNINGTQILNSVFDGKLTGSVTSGFVLLNGGTILNCCNYSTQSSTYNFGYSTILSKCYHLTTNSNSESSTLLTDTIYKNGTLFLNLNSSNTKWYITNEYLVYPSLYSETNLYKTTSNISTTLKGEGTKENPYFVNDSIDWKEFKNLIDSGYTDLYIKQGSDITLNDQTLLIGSLTNPFIGTFNGNGYTLTLDLKVSADTNYTRKGVFVYTKNSNFYNINLVGDLTVNNYIGQCGALIGTSLGTININNCNNSVNIKGVSICTSLLSGSYIGYVASGTINFDNCIFNGTLQKIGNGLYCGFVGISSNNINYNKCCNLSTDTHLTYSFSQKEVLTDCYILNSSTSTTQATKISNVSNLISDINTTTYYYYLYNNVAKVYILTDESPAFFAEYYTNSSSSSGIIDGDYYIDFNLSWSSDNWNETQKGIDPKSIHFESDITSFGFLLIDDEDNSYTTRDINIYPDTLNTVVTSGTPDITDRYTKYISISSEFNLNSATVEGGKFSSDLLSDDTLKTFKITPAMEFGLLPTFEIVLNINFSQIGSGNTSIDEWRYFKQDESVILTYGFQDYPKPGYKTTNIELDFISMDDLMKSEKILDNIVPTFTIQNQGRPSYSGSFTTEIEFDDVFLENKLYLVKIVKTVSNTSNSNSNDIIIGYRFLYTTDFFNDYYISDTEDFKDLNIPDQILDSGISCSGDQVLNQINTLYNDSSKTISTEYDINKCIVDSNESLPNYLYGECVNTLTVNNFSVTSNITSDYDLFDDFDLTKEDSNIELAEDSAGSYNSGTIVVSDTSSSTWTLYLTGTLNYIGELVPLLYNNYDSYYYGLTYDNGHFNFESLSILGDDGHINEGYTGYDDGSDVRCESKSDYESKTDTDNVYYYGDSSTANNAYLIIDEQIEDVQRYRASGNQCYKGSDYQVQLEPYTSGKNNIFCISFGETEKGGSDSMTYLNVEKPVGFYYSIGTTTPRKIYINKASGNGGKLKTYQSGSFGSLIYSDLVGTFMRNDLGARLLIGNESNNTKLTIGTNGNISLVTHNYTHPTYGIMMKAVNSENEEVYLFTNNFAIGCYDGSSKLHQQIVTYNKLTFGDILAMFLMQTYKYSTENTEREVLYPSNIDSNNSSGTSCNLVITTNVKVNSFNIESYRRDDILKKVSDNSDLSSNLYFSSEIQDTSLTLTDNVSYSVKATNVYDSDFDLTDSSIKSVLVRNTNGKTGIIECRNNLSETKVYAVNSDMSQFVDLSKYVSDDYADYYKLLSDFNYDEKITYSGNITEDGDQILNPRNLQCLKLDDEGILIIDLDLYKKSANVTFTFNNCRNYSCSHVYGVSSKFTISKLLSVLP